MFKQNILMSFRNLSHVCHYENMSVQNEAILKVEKMIFFRCKNVTFFIFAQNIDCGYMLEPPRNE